MPLLAPQELHTYFTTAVTANRRRTFQVEENAELLLKTLAHYRAQKRFELHAFVIMPDHLHLLLTPAPDVSLEKAMQFIKGGFSHRFKSKLDVWYRSFNESQVRDQEKFAMCQTYIEHNPVRAGLVLTTDEYPYSSVARPDIIDARPAHFRSLRRGAR